MKCANINSPEFKELLKDTNLPSFKLSSIIGVLSENQNDDYFPSRDEISNYLNKSEQSQKNIIHRKDIDYKQNQNINIIELLKNNINSDKPSFEFLKIAHNVIKGLEKDYVSYYGDKYLEIKFENLKEISGNYNRDENLITVSNEELKDFVPNTLYSNRDEKIAYIISHELIHKLLPQSLSLKEEYYNEYQNSFGPIDEITLKLKSLYDFAKNNSKDLSSYGFTNVSEFAAEAMTNLAFQQKLANIPFDSKKSTWDKFISILTELFSKYNTKIQNTVLEQTLYEITNYISENYTNVSDLSFKKDKDNIQLNLSEEGKKMETLKDEDYFDKVISPIVSKMSKLFPQVKSKVVSESEFNSLPAEVQKALSTLKSLGKTPNSFYFNGTVYIIKERITPEITMEEFLHPFINGLESENYGLFKSLLLEAKKLFPEMKNRVFKEYGEVYDSTFDLNREFLTQALAHLMEKNRLGELSTEDKSILDKFFDWIKDLFNRMVNPKQVSNFSLQELDSNLTLSELALLLSKDGTTFDSLYPSTKAKEENINRIYWSFTEDQAKRYQNYPANTTQKNILNTLIANTESIKKVFPESGGHNYVLALDKNGNVDVPMEGVTSIVHPEKYIGNKGMGAFGTVIHNIADLINEKNKTSFSEQDIENILSHVGLEDFTADFNMEADTYSHLGELPSKSMAIYITKNIADYMLALKQKGSLVLSEIILGDPDRLIGGTSDIIEIQQDGKIVIHDFKTIGLFFTGNDSMFENLPSYELEPTENTEKAMSRAWESQYRKPGYTKQLSLYKALLNKLVGTPLENISLQIIPIFYRKAEPLEITESGAKEFNKNKVFVPFIKGKNQIYFPIKFEKNPFTQNLSINQESSNPYSLKYNQPYVKKIGIKTIDPINTKDEKKNKDYSEMEKLQNSEKFNTIINDIFVQVNKIVTQYGKSKEETKKELYDLFTGEEDETGDLESIKSAIDLLYTDIQNGVDVQEASIKTTQMINYLNETFLGIQRIKEKFIAKTANQTDLDNSMEIYKQISSLRAIKNFSKSFEPILKNLSQELEGFDNNNVFKQMVKTAKSDIDFIETLYQDKVLPLLARNLELQITPEVRENVNKEIDGRIKIQEDFLKGLPIDSPKIPRIKKIIRDLEKQRELMAPDKTIFEKMIKGEYGDASMLWSNLIANINNPDMIIASATKILSDILIDLNTMSNTVFHSYGEQLEKYIAVVGDDRKNVNKMWDKLTYSVDKVSRDKNGNLKTWKQRHIITDIDENIYFKHDMLVYDVKDAIASEDPKKILETKKKLKEFEKKNFVSQYTEEVQKIFDSLDIEIEGLDNDGNKIIKNPLEERNNLFKEINRIKSNYSSSDFFQGIVKQEDIENLERIWREIRFLNLDYDENGNIKPDIDLKIAKVLRDRSESLDKVAVKTENKKLWEKYRQKVIQTNGIESDELKEWDSKNSKITPLKEVYDERDRLNAKIKAIFSKYNTPEAEVLIKQNDLLWEKMRNLVNPFRKQGTIDANSMSESIKEKILEYELEAGDLLVQIKELSEKLSEEDGKTVSDIFETLSLMFVNQPTEQYYDTYYNEIDKVKSILKRDEAPSIDQMLMYSEWYKKSHIVTEVEGETSVKAVYYYRINRAADESMNVPQPGPQYSFREYPKNPDYYDMFERRTVRKSSDFYRPKHYKDLEKGTSKESKIIFDTLEFLKERTRDTQKDLHKNNQIGYAIPTLRKGTWERIMEGSAINSYKNLAANIFKNEQDTDEGIADSRQVITDITGEETRFIPLRYNTKIEEEEQSLDLMKGFFLYEMSSRKAKMLEESKDYFKALEEQLIIHTPKKSDAVEAITSRLNEKFKDFNINVENPKGNSNERADSISDVINRVFYDEYKKDWFKADILGKTITDTKIMDGIFSLAGTTMMFGNVWNWGVNFISGNIQSLLEASSKRYMNPGDLSWAKIETTKVALDVMKDRSKLTNHSFFTQMARHYNYAQGKFENELGDKFSWTEWTQSTKQVFFAGKVYGEWEMQTANFLGLMRAKKVFQKNNKGEMVMMSLWEAYEKGPKGVPLLKKGILNADGTEFTNQQEKDYIRRIQGINKSLNGAYAKIDQLKLEKYSMMRALTFMRKYFVPMFIERFGGLRTDLEFGDIREGYYTTTFKLLYEHFALGNNIFERYKSKDGLTERQRQNLKKMSAELIGFGILSFIIGLLGVLGADDDDDKMKYLRYLANKVRREYISTVPLPGLGLQEFYSVWASPMIAAGQVGNVFELTSKLFLLPINVATDGHYDSDLYYQKSTGPWDKGDSKLPAAIYRVVGAKTNIFDADALEKSYEFQVRWK
jgi:hypothetical protein